MNKILIASTNKDKISIVKNIVNSVSSEKFEILSLRDVAVTSKDDKECGTIFERAEKKAKECLNGLEDKNEFRFVIGIDDGIIIKGTLYENVKDFIKPIVEEDFLSENEIVYIARAYHFIRNDGKEYSILTKIPFEFHKPKEKVKIEPFSYPLSFVLCQVNSDLPISKNTPEQNNEYYLNYSLKQLVEVLNYRKWSTSYRLHKHEAKCGQVGGIY